MILYSLILLSSLPISAQSLENEQVVFIGKIYKTKCRKGIVWETEHVTADSIKGTLGGVIGFSKSGYYITEYYRIDTVICGNWDKPSIKIQYSSYNPNNRHQLFNHVLVSAKPSGIMKSDEIKQWYDVYKDNAGKWYVGYGVFLNEKSNLGIHTLDTHRKEIDIPLRYGSKRKLMKDSMFGFEEYSDLYYSLWRRIFPRYGVDLDVFYKTILH